MSVARIISRVREDAHELANDLRGRGFEVEVLAPGEIAAHAADLEISLEDCAAEEALRSAESVPAPEDVCVFIAPGAIVESARPIVVIPLLSDVAQTPAAETPVRWHAAAIKVEEPRLPNLVTAEQVIGKTKAVEIEPELIHSFELESETGKDASPALDADAVKPELPVPVKPTSIPPGRRVWYGTVVLRVRIAPSDQVFWKVATGVALMSVFGLFLTLSAHRLPPLPSAMQETFVEVQQPIPLAKVKANAAKPVARVAPPAEPLAKAVPEPAPAEARETVSARPAPAVTKRVVALRKPDQPSRNREDDLIAEDTVVRFVKRPAAPAMQAQKKPAIKRYTDAN